jgi:alkanesulfonate monooxygenase SsuD/methylene tetrahydromethanopterin reductase-like flavin-dependent oxidoreductase (luciferase family)
VRPHPVQQPRIPIWIGGHSDAALRRVVDVADGWHPLGLRPPVMLHPDELASRVGRLRELASKAGRDPAEIVVAFKAPFAFRDAPGRDRALLTGSPAQLVEDLQAYVAAGARHFVLDFSVPTPSQMTEAMERFAADVRPHVRGA